MHPLGLELRSALVLGLCSLGPNVPTLHAQERHATALESATVDRVVAALEHLAQEHHVPGMGLALVTPEGTFVRGIGHADLAGTEVTADTTFEIGSTTKTFTTVLAAMLAEEGLLRFEDPVRRHVPEFHLKDAAADEQVILADVFSHRTGLCRTDVLMAAGPEVGPLDVVRQLAKAEAMAPFRRQFLYNNQMFLVGGMACEAAGGASYGELLHEYVFDRLGMARTCATFEEAIQRGGFSEGHKLVADTAEVLVEPTRGIRLARPAGSIASCPNDMARYVTFLLQRGTTADGEPLLAPEVFDEELWSPHVSMGPGAAYGLGFMLGEWHGRKLVHHGGNIDGFTSQMALLPDDGIGFSLLMNLSFSAVQTLSTDAVFAAVLGEDSGSTNVGAEVLSDPDPAAAPPYDRAALAAFVGEYDLAAAKSIWTVLVNDEGKLAVDVPGQTVYVLRWPDAEGRWAFDLVPDQIQVSFQTADLGIAESLTVFQAGQELVLPRHAVAEGLPSVDEILARIDRLAPKAALAALCPLRMSGRLELPNQGIEGTVRVHYRDDVHWRMDLDLGLFGAVVTVVNGEQGWTWSGLQGREEMTPDDLRRAQAMSPFFPLVADRESFRSLRVLGVDGEGDAERIRFEGRPLTGDPQTYVLDREGHILEIESAIRLGEAGSLPITATLSDHREVGGFPMAFRTATRNPASGAQILVYETVETKVAIPEALWTER